jgi:cytochrome b involved in lipid metabolism
MVIGKDATESFEDVGHSDEAREILKTLFIGTFGELDVCSFPHVRSAPTAHRPPLPRIA